MTPEITIPELALMLLVGPCGSGRSTFAAEHFQPTEVVSLDACRARVADDPADRSASQDAVELARLIVDKRLARGRLTVVDAPNLEQLARQPLLALAREHYCEPVAIVFDPGEAVCLERARQRPDGLGLIRQQCAALAGIVERLQRDGIQTIHQLTSPEAIATARVIRRRLAPDRREDHGPFDIVGDVHGCFDELVELLGLLGYAIEPVTGDGQPGYRLRPPAGRQLIMLGDLVDRGPRIPEVLRLTMDAVASGVALCLPGNHDMKLLRLLQGHQVRIAHGIEATLAQLEMQPPAFSQRVRRFLEGLTSHYQLDDGKLVVAHAGLKAEMQGRETRRVRDFALYGDTTGEVDEYGLPIRLNWALHYHGTAMVVYGHTPVALPEWLNDTINIDTGCVFGGRLTALRYPERELVSVPARREYAVSARPFLPRHR